MSQDPNQTVGQIEKKTQARVVALFREKLGYHYLGDWMDRNNRNIKEDWICRKFRVRAITMEKKETSYGETEATGYFRRAA